MQQYFQKVYLSNLHDNKMHKICMHLICTSKRQTAFSFRGGVFDSLTRGFDTGPSL